MRSLEYCDMAIDKITALSKATGNHGLMHRVTDPLCMKGFVLYSMGDESKALSVLAKVKQSYSIDDNYTKLFQATIEYGISLRFRDKALEQSIFSRILTLKSLLNRAILEEHDRVLKACPLH